MKKLLLASLLLLTGCEHKLMKLYVQQLEGLLAEYQAGVSGRIVAERKLYAEMAERNAVEAERSVYESLLTERQRQQRLQTAALLEKRMPPSQMQERMRETAELELARSREFFERELAIETSYQAGLGKVALDARKIEALGTALKAMRETKGLPVEFAQAFQREFQAEECKSIAREIAIQEESVAILRAEKREDEAKKLEAELAALKARKCK